ncbi:MAG: cytochrome c3 family protein [Pyrinomonadaceae bacterium]|nr:cytochrome c3 family protein [Acidobacteriota bacterium]MBP7375210.1 cytochrome c3 family protein [Pyrinomonadaceae bacterium]
MTNYFGLNMRQIINSITVFVILAVGFLFVDGNTTNGQRLPPKKAETKRTIPEVIILAKGSKQGQVTFNHVKHNGGEYNIGGPILCTECHHTAQPASELVRFPPLKTAWPADRTTTLTAELFAEDPAKAGVASCRDCHSRDGAKPKLLDKTPAYDDAITGKTTKLTNQIALHQTCDVCHFQIGFRVAGSKAPTSTNCASCHKAAAKKH